VEQQLKLLVDSYGLEVLLEQNDIKQETILRWVVEEELLDLNDYFFDDVPEEELEEET
jgi:hypothetical protein